jgi:hypothetical protein
MEAAVLVVAALGLIALGQVFAIRGRRQGFGWLTWAGIIPLLASVACLVWAVVLTVSVPSN